MEKGEANSSVSGSYVFNASPQNSSIPMPGVYLRLFNELKDIQNDNMLNIEASEDSNFKWNISFPAPNGKTVKAELHFDSQFPSTPPRMFIKQKLFHPNISNKREVCFQGLKENWAPNHSIWSLILSVQVLLSEPKPNDPVNAHAAKLLLHKPDEYHQIASQCFHKLDFCEEENPSELNLIEWHSSEQASKHSPKPVTGAGKRIFSDLMEIQNDNMLNIEVKPSPDDDDRKTEHSEEHSPKPVIRAGKRILNELMEIQNGNVFDIEVNPYYALIFMSDITVPAPNGRAVKAKLYFETQVPCASPRIIIYQMLFHPNISDKGEVCFLDVNEKWNPLMSIWPLIQSVKTLLSEPNPHHAVKNAYAANLLLTRPEEYHKIALEFFNELDFYDKGQDNLSDNVSPSYASNAENSEEPSLEHSPKPVKRNGKRILNDLMEIQNDNMLQIEVNPSDDSIFKWDVTFPAPNGNAVNAELHFDSQYPYTAPKMFIKQKLFHPNISDKGEVCFLDVNEKWNPTMSIWSLILSVQLLLSEPNPHDPANSYAANLLLNKPDEYHEIASGYFNALDFNLGEEANDDEEIAFQMSLFESFRNN